MLNFSLVDIDRNTAVFQNPERGIMDVVAVQVGDDYPVNSRENFTQGIPASPHGGESGIEEESG